MSKIEWTDTTWNPTVGCSKISPGCKNCYAIRHAQRLGANPNPKIGPIYKGLTEDGDWTGIVRLVPERLGEPLRWRKPRRVFVDSMSDLFHPAISEGDIRAVFMTMARARQHTFQVLTKRPQRMLEILRAWQSVGLTLREGVTMRPDSSVCLPNVWLGVSVENQRYADERIPLLLEAPAAARFLSCEPLLGPLDLWSFFSLIDQNGEPSMSRCNPDGSSALGWVIVGGESGPGARPCRGAWVKKLVNDCEEAGVACFVKQLGAAFSDETNGIAGSALKVPVEAAPLISLRLKDRKGGDIEEWPAALRVRQLPEVNL